MNRNSSIQHEGDVLARSVKQLMLNRRQIICTGGALLASPFLALRQARAAAPSLRLTGVELLPIRATARTVWLFVRLRADNGLSGLGEASDAFGFANTTTANADTMLSPVPGAHAGRARVARDRRLRVGLAPAQQ